MDIRDAIVADKFDSTGNPILYRFDDSSPAVKTSFCWYSCGRPSDKDGKFVFLSMNESLYKVNLETGEQVVKYIPKHYNNQQNIPYYNDRIYVADPEGRYAH